MIRRTLQFGAGMAAILAALAATPLHAGIFRAYLSLSGNDGNACTLQAPCRLLPAALAAANDGGEVWMLDSANYNNAPVVVDKGIKILAIPGEVGSVVGNSGVDALIINAPGKDVTLRNLVVLNLGGAINGVNIQDAAAVHIEKTTVHDFSDPSGACIRFTNTNASLRMFIDDSFLRHCRTAIQMTVLGLPTGNRASLIVDNTRIERAFANSGGSLAVWQQGCIDITFRNGTISRQDVAFQVDSLVAGCFPALRVQNAAITRVTTGIQVSNATPSAYHSVYLTNSEIGSPLDGIVYSNSGDTAQLNLELVDSNVTDCGNNGVMLVNTATDNTAGINFNAARANITHVANDAITLNAPNGSRVRAWVRDSTISNVTGRVVKTGGAVGTVQISLIRSNMNAAGYVLDHGYGTVRLDGNHMTNLTNTFVNNGSADVRSLNNNWLTNFTNTTPGFVYITPTIISPI